MSATFADIQSACHLLFGDQTPVCPDFMEYMQIAGLKSAYRTLAMQSHPDRAAALGQEPEILARRFRLIRHAYELLKPYVLGEAPMPEEDAFAGCLGGGTRRRDQGRGGAEPPPPPQAAGPAADATPDFQHRGRMPERRLRFGQYLFYRRVISWNALISALVWQRRSRPRLGDLALRHGWLTDRDILLLQRLCRPGELWGETALRERILTRAQLSRLLGCQRLLNLPIGRYFLQAELVAASSLQTLLSEHFRHNFRAGLRQP